MESKWNTGDSCITVEYIQFIVLLRKYSKINWGKYFIKSKNTALVSGFFYKLQINWSIYMLYSVAKIQSYCKVEKYTIK